MDFLQNPFYILNATPKDNRRRIMELADSRSLLHDPDDCREAAATLTHPRRRLYAEIAWLPCSRLEHVEDFQKLLNEVLFGISNYPSIARSNLLAAELVRLPDCSSDILATRILRIAHSSEDIDPEQVHTVVNAGRNVSGFPMTKLSDMEMEIQNLRDYYRRVLTSVLEKQSAMHRAEAMTRVIKQATRGTQKIPLLINRLVDWYEVDAQKSLEEHERRIENLDEKLRVAADAERPDSALTPLVNQLIHAVKNWDAIAQPIQLSKQNRGLSHKRSSDLAWRVRDLALHLWNEYDKLDFCQQLIQMLQEAFAEVSEVATIINEDTKTLVGIAQRHGHLMQGVKQFEGIKVQVDKLRTAADANKPDSILSPMVNRLIQTVKKWDASVQSNEANIAVANLVRESALYLWNEHSKLDFSRQITSTLQKVFAAVDEVVQLLAEDAKTLADIAARRAQLLNIESLIENLRNAANRQSPDSILAPMVNQLLQGIKNWDTTAPSTESHLIAGLVRNLAVELFNDHNKLDFSRLLIHLLKEMFADGSEVADRIAQDAKTLDEIDARRMQNISVEDFVRLTEEQLRQAAQQRTERGAKQSNNVVDELENLVQTQRRAEREAKQKGQNGCFAVLCMFWIVFGLIVLNALING